MQLTCVPTIAIQLELTITENEARALKAMAGYGDDAFLKVFYEKLGESYMKPHEDGIRSLFKGIRDILPQHLSNAETARKCFVVENFKPQELSQGQINGLKENFLTK